MLSVEEIRTFIENDMSSEKKRYAKVAERYYEADHDIKDYRMFFVDANGQLKEDKYRSNIRIAHPFFTEIVDQVVQFELSNEEGFLRSDIPELQKELDYYFNSNEEFRANFEECVTGTVVKGFDYMYAYKNKDGRIAFQYADGMGVIEVKENETDDHCAYVIFWYVDKIGKDGKKIKRIQVWDKSQTYYYCQVDSGDIVLDHNQKPNPRPHVIYQKDNDETIYYEDFGFIPFFHMRYNRKETSGLKPIKGLIDDYDMMECGLSNNLQDFDKPIHLVKGFQGVNLDELQQNIITKKILGVDDTGGLDILTVDVPYQARKTKADEDEKNIYRFGMGFNSAQSGDGNITNVVIRSRYTLLDLKANKLIKRIKRFLKPIIQVVLDEINDQNGTDYQYTDVVVEFIPVIPTNEQENAQIAQIEAQTEQLKINNVLTAATMIGDEETLKAICGILDLDFDELKGQLEQLNEQKNTMDAQATLDDVVVDDEQTAEAGSATIPE